MVDGPFADEMVEHYLKSVQTQHGIIKYVEVMARVLAEAGRASNKVNGDSPAFAVRRWGDVMVNRALEILKEPELSKGKYHAAIGSRQAGKREGLQRFHAYPVDTCRR